MCVDTPANARLIRREENRRTNRSRECENYVSIWLCIRRRRDTFVFKATTVEWACISWLLRLYHAFVFFFFFSSSFSRLCWPIEARNVALFSDTANRKRKGKRNTYTTRYIRLLRKKGNDNSHSCATFPRSVTCGIFTTSVKYYTLWSQSYC